MDNKKLITSAVAALALIPNIANAWNSQGHVTVAEVAYQNLTPAARSQVDVLASKAYQSMPEDVKAKMDRFEGASQFARLAMVPDLIRKVPAAEVWKSMGEQVPASLNQWDEKATGAWHYINLTYPAASQCNFIRVPNIQLVNSHLFEEFAQQPQAASMMFMSHFAGDSHQPMHSVAQSLSSDKCESDLGGNKYTLNIPQKDLHHLWDSGMGFLETPYNVHDVAAQLQQAYPKASMELGETGNINLWLEESLQLADFGYSVEKDATPSPEHYRQGTLYVKQRLSQAGYRLADEINAVFAEK